MDSADKIILDKLKNDLRNNFRFNNTERDDKILMGDAKDQPIIESLLYDMLSWCYENQFGAYLSDENIRFKCLIENLNLYTYDMEFLTRECKISRIRLKNGGYANGFEPIYDSGSDSNDDGFYMESRYMR